MSKCLDAIKKIKWKLEDEGILGEEYELCDVIKKEFKEYEDLKLSYGMLVLENKNLWKKGMALEIIKSKPVNTNWFVFYKDYDEYYLDCEYANESKRLTEEEWNFLKDVLL